MKQFRKVLVTTDTRLEKHPIVDEAAEIALRNEASLKLVDVVPPLSWIARMTMEDPDEVAESMIRRKAEKLEILAEPIREKGVKTETKVLFGTTSVEIIREVLRGGHDLVLRVSKAKTSRRSGFFGGTGIELLRKCPCAVWLVCPTTSAQFKHVLACVDTDRKSEVTEELNSKVFELSSNISRIHGIDQSVIHVWGIDGEQFLRKRMRGDEYDAMVSQRQKEAKRRLDAFLAKQESTLPDDHVHLVKGDVWDTIPSIAAAEGVDLVVMGVVARSGPSGWIMGNVTEQVLASLESSVLALKPRGFVSPITLPKEELDSATSS